LVDSSGPLFRVDFFVKQSLVMTALRTIRQLSAMGCELELAASTKLDLDAHISGCGVYDRSFVDGLLKLGNPSRS